MKNNMFDFILLVLDLAIWNLKLEILVGHVFEIIHHFAGIIIR